MGESHNGQSSQVIPENRPVRHVPSDDQPYLVYQKHSDGSFYPSIEFGEATNGAGANKSQVRRPLSSEDIQLPLRVLMQMYPPTGESNA